MNTKEMILSSNQYLQELIYAITQKNLVYNHDFRYFSNKTVNQSGLVDYKHPDGWIYKDPGSGAQIGKPDETCCMIVTSNDNTSVMTFEQSLHEFPQWENHLKEKMVTARVCMNISVGCEVSVILSDGISTSSQSSKESGDIDFNLNLIVNEKADKLKITIQSNSNSAVIKISKVFANIGAVAIETLPCMVQGIIGERKQYIATENAPAEELSLCNEATELTENQTRLHSVINERFGKGSKYSLLPDMRGYFSRAWNNKSKNDPDAQNRKELGKSSIKGDRVSTVEDEEFLHHEHKLDFSTGLQIPPGKEGTATIINLTTDSQTQETGGNETRPKNIAELYTIKWA